MSFIPSFVTCVTILSGMNLTGDAIIPPPCFNTGGNTLIKFVDTRSSNLTFDYAYFSTENGNWSNGIYEKTNVSSHNGEVHDWLFADKTSKHYIAFKFTINSKTNNSSVYEYVVLSMVTQGKSTDQNPVIWGYYTVTSGDFPGFGSPVWNLFGVLEARNMDFWHTQFYITLTFSGLNPVVPKLTDSW